LTSIRIAPANPTVALGTAEQFTATGDYSDSSTQNLTSLVNWSSSNTGVALIQNSGRTNVGLVTAAGYGVATISAAYGGFSDTSSLTVSNTLIFNTTPLMDMPQANGSCLTYKGFQGGLYENCSNSAPSDHAAVGQAVANGITPINGKMVMLALGMSNAADEWGQFMAAYASNPAVNPNLAIVNGGIGGLGMCSLATPFGQPPISTCGGNSINAYDFILNNRLPPYTENQVEVVWLKEATVGSPQVGWPALLPANDGVCALPLIGQVNKTCADAYVYEKWTGAMVRAAKQRYPNLKIIFISSRTYGGYNQISKSHEPLAFEEGFAVKWAIQAQINQADRGGAIDPMAGDLSYSAAPWLAWGPYIWASGPIPRSDGMVWCNDGQNPTDSNGNPISPPPPGSRCTGVNAGLNDYQGPSSDQLHPSTPGIQRRTNPQFWNFFTSSPEATPWFLH